MGLRHPRLMEREAGRGVVAAQPCVQVGEHDVKLAPPWRASLARHLHSRSLSRLRFQSTPNVGPMGIPLTNFHPCLGQAFLGVKSASRKSLQGDPGTIPHSWPRCMPPQSVTTIEPSGAGHSSGQTRLPTPQAQIGRGCQVETTASRMVATASEGFNREVAAAAR